MAWETRKKGRYYYRSRRVGDRVVKTYYGAGDVGQMAADIVAEARARRSDEAETLHESIASLKALDGACTLLMGAALMAAGYGRTNHGTWRRRRGGAPKNARRGGPRTGRDPDRDGALGGGRCDGPDEAPGTP